MRPSISFRSTTIRLRHLLPPQRASARAIPERSNPTTPRKWQSRLPPGVLLAFILSPLVRSISRGEGRVFLYVRFFFCVVGFICQLAIFRPISGFLCMYSLRQVAFGVRVSRTKLCFFGYAPHSIGEGRHGVTSHPNHLSNHAGYLSYAGHRVVVLQCGRVGVFVFLRVFFRRFSTFYHNGVDVVKVRGFPIQVHLYGLYGPFYTPWHYEYVKDPSRCRSVCHFLLVGFLPLRIFLRPTHNVSSFFHGVKASPHHVRQ